MLENVVRDLGDPKYFIICEIAFDSALAAFSTNNLSKLL